MNGRSLEGLSRLEASDLIKNSVDIVDLVVLRGMCRDMIGHL